MSGVSLLYTANSLEGLTVSGTLPAVAMRIRTRADSVFLFIVTGTWWYTELTKSHDLSFDSRFHWGGGWGWGRFAGCRKAGLLSLCPVRVGG